MSGRVGKVWVGVNWKHLIAPAVAIVIVFAVTFAYFSERESRIKAEDIKSQIDAVMAERQKNYDQSIEVLEEEIKNIKSAPQATKVIEKYVPVTQGQTAQVTPQQLPPEIKKELPDSPGYVVGTQEREIALAQDQVKCQETKAGLVKCEQDLTDSKKKADTFEKALKGGSTLQRIKQNAKWMVIGAGAGAIIVKVLTH